MVLSLVARCCGRILRLVRAILLYLPNGQVISGLSDQESSCLKIPINSGHCKNNDKLDQFLPRVGDVISYPVHAWSAYEYRASIDFVIHAHKQDRLSSQSSFREFRIILPFIISLSSFIFNIGIIISKING